MNETATQEAVWGINLHLYDPVVDNKEFIWVLYLSTFIEYSIQSAMSDSINVNVIARTKRKKKEKKDIYTKNNNK